MSTPSSSRERVMGEAVEWTARWTLRWLVIILGAVAVGWVVGQLWSILLPVVLALILTTVLQPPARWLEGRRVPAPVAALLVVFAALGVVAFSGIVLAPSVGDQAVELSNSASDGLSQLEEDLRSSRFGITGEQVETAVDAAQDRLRSSATNIASGVLIGVSAVTSALLTLVLTLVLSFFFLKDGRRFTPWLERLAGRRAGPHLAEVCRRAWETLGGFVRTQALVGLIDAVLIGLGLVIIGVPLAVPLAVLTFIAAFAPIVGAVTVGILAVLVALVANGWVSAVIVLIIVLVVQQLEGNVLLPWLQGRSLRLHAAVVLLSIVLGSTLFGIAGAFLSVPLVAVAAVIMRYLDELIDEGTAPAPAEAGSDEPSLDEVGSDEA